MTTTDNSNEHLKPNFHQLPPAYDQQDTDRKSTKRQRLKMPVRSNILTVLTILQKSGNIIAIVYIFGGEVLPFVPEHMKASTVIAAKTAGIQEEVTLDVAVEKTQAMAYEQTVRAEVNLAGQCNDQVLKTSLSMFQSCSADSKKSIYQCRLERDIWLQNNECPDFPETELVLQANKKDL